MRYMDDLFRSPAISSGELSSTTQVSTVPGVLLHVHLMPPISDYSTLKVYDSASAQTTSLLASLRVTAGNNSISWSACLPVKVASGVYAVLSGAATTYSIGYKNLNKQD